MSVQENQEPRWTYKTEEATYDVGLLSEEALVSFSYLAEVEGEIQSLAKRIDVLRAASVTFKGIVEEALHDDAIIETNVEDTEEDSEETEK